VNQIASDLEIKEIIATYKEEIQGASIFVSDNIPERKLAAARRSYAQLENDEEALLLIDTSQFGNAWDGAVLSNVKLYARNLEGTHTIHLTDIKTITRVDERDNEWVYINGTRFLCLNAHDRFPTRLVIEMLQKITRGLMSSTNKSDADLSWSSDRTSRYPDLPPRRSESMDVQTTIPATGQTTRLSALPRDSALLGMSEAAIHMTAAFAGLLMGVFASLAIYSIAPEGTTMARLFDLDTPQGFLPPAMLGMFFWGAILLGLRRLRVGRAESMASPETVDQCRGCVSTLPLEDILADIDKTRATRSSFLLRYIRIVVRQWATKPSLQDALSLLNQQVSGDAEHIHHAYGLVKTFVWALPVLGLIGTVMGIALAVGDFGQLIGGNVDDVAVIKQSLVQVTGGLSFAFTTTLLGLLSALLLVLPSSSLQAREERLVTRTEGIVADTILPQLQKRYPEVEVRGGAPDAELWRATLSEIAQSAVQTAATTANRIIADSHEAHAEWHRQRRAELERLADAIGEATGRIGEDLRTGNDDFLTRLSLIRDAMDQQASNMREGLDRARAVSEQSAGRLDATMQKHDEIASDLVVRMQSIQNAVDSLLPAQTALSAAMQELTNGRTAKTLESLSASYAALNRQADAIDRTLSGVARATERLTECQTALQEGLKQIDTIGLPSALDRLGRTLTDVSQVLQGFQEPVVFQAVRVSSVAPTEPSLEKHRTGGGTRYQEVGDKS